MTAQSEWGKLYPRKVIQIGGVKLSTQSRAPWPCGFIRQLFWRINSEVWGIETRRQLFLVNDHWRTKEEFGDEKRARPQTDDHWRASERARNGLDLKLLSVNEDSIRRMWIGRPLTHEAFKKKSMKQAKKPVGGLSIECYQSSCLQRRDGEKII